MSFEPRVVVPLDAVVDSIPDMPTVLRHYLPEVAEVRVRFNVALDSSVVDGPIREMTRIYNADAIDCNYCRNVRYSKDGEAVLKERFVDKVRDFESADLPEAHKAALRLAEAYAIAPAGISAQTEDSVREHFTARQTLELGLQLLRCRAGSKTLVSLGLEPLTMEITLI